jgi:hypothetical protein
MNDIAQWISGAEYNAQGGTTSNSDGVSAAIVGVTNVATAIFGQIGANKYVRPSRFKNEDVIIPEELRDNRAYITAAIAVVLLIAVATLVIYQNR